MKQLRNFFVLALGLLVITACGSDPKSQISKKWKLSELNAPGMGDLESLSDEEKEMFKKFIDEASFEFKKDGTYEIKLMGQTTKGTWEIDKEGKVLTTKEEGGSNSQKLNIKELSGDKMVVSDDTGEMSMTLVPA